MPHFTKQSSPVGSAILLLWFSDLLRLCGRFNSLRARFVQSDASTIPFFFCGATVQVRA